ncbi:hypothetical protein SCLCIDRAFT_20749 [Scleroderma citrinum Foug A]|uniref:Uncharacterized protein n=1 Tax=Scleroderma citrinum Foug A TaxID=1036808 RepID=A0A0C3ARZ8_9AGAM|nr:hypothetical protein SCLCIDRAFT_20749 [Scleroderma citrinum Foug A]
MSSTFDVNTAYDALDNSLVTNVFDLDSWSSSLSPSVSSPEPICNSPRPRQRRHTRTRGHPRPTPTVVLSPVTCSTSAVPVLSTSAVASSSTQSLSVPGRADKGKGRQQTTPTPSPTSSVDTAFPTATASAGLTPEQHLCLVWMLKHLDEWFTRGWEPGVDKSRLRSLAEIFDSAEAVAEGGLSDLRRADLAWRLADSEGWEKSAGSSIMGAIDIQVTVTKILYKDYGDSLIASFRSFLGQKEVEMGNRGRPCDVSGPPLPKTMSHRDLEPVVQKRKGMREAEYLLKRRIPTYRRMMKHARVSPNISPLLAEHLTASGVISYSLSDSPFPEPTPSAQPTPRLRSLTPRSYPSLVVANFNTCSPDAEPCPTTTLSADIDVSAATPLDTGLPTMTEIVAQFMEDLLTQEFCPVMLDEDI